jgi:hypothetical protein
MEAREAFAKAGIRVDKVLNESKKQLEGRP